MTNLLRFFYTGNETINLVNNVVFTLNSIQSYYKFFTNVDEYKPKINKIVIDYNEDILSEKLTAYADKKYPDYYPILVCDLPLRNELCSSFNDEYAIISIDGWGKEYPELSYDKILCFQLIDVLITRRLELPVHIKESKACPLDYCGSSGDLRKGIERSDFCSECKNYLQEAIRSGKMSIPEIGAIYRILDWIAERKRIFVAMPFSKIFNSVYDQVIKNVAVELDFKCIRIDRVYKPNTIISEIFEEIYRSSVLVCDISGKNPNVFYEIGYAHAIARPTILLTQNIREAPFDIKHYRLIEYKANKLSELREKLKECLLSFI